MKKNAPYTGYDPLILRDWLAIDRTVLANERTLLAYGRTVIALVAAGVTLIKIFPADLFAVIASILLILGGTILAGVGLVRFITIRTRLKSAGKPEGAGEPQE